MIVFEFSKENDVDAKELTKLYDDAVYVESHSLSENDIIQVIIPLAILIKTLKPIIVKLIESKKCNIKYNGVEIENVSSDNVMDIIQTLKEDKKKNK